MGSAARGRAATPRGIRGIQRYATVMVQFPPDGSFEVEVTAVLE